VCVWSGHVHIQVALDIRCHCPAALIAAFNFSAVTLNFSVLYATVDTQTLCAADHRFADF
jgi:hypothetical protein